MLFPHVKKIGQFSLRSEAGLGILSFLLTPSKFLCWMIEYVVYLLTASIWPCEAIRGPVRQYGVEAEVWLLVLLLSSQVNLGKLLCLPGNSVSASVKWAASVSSPGLRVFITQRI